MASKSTCRSGGADEVQLEDSKDPSQNLILGVWPILQKSMSMHSTVLVVEDNEHLLEPICELLRVSGFALLAVGSGSEALAVLRSYGGKIDVLLTDMNLPGISGDEVARHGREVRPGIGVVYMSGFSRIDFVRKGQLPQDATFLEKPFLRVTLVEKIREALEICGD